jgi:hypothetical protein
MSDSGLKLKRDHAYYAHQVNMHMACTGYDYCDFVLWGPDASQNADTLFIEHLNRDEEFLVALLPKIKEFIVMCIIPELLCKLHTRLSRCVVEKKVDDVISGCNVMSSAEELQDGVVVDVCVDNAVIDHDGQTTVCYCKQPFSSDTPMLKCTADLCTTGRYFHVNCLGYKRVPKQEGWICYGCRAELAKQRKRKPCIVDVPSRDN